MADWPIQRIDTHVTDAQGRLTSQYADADKLRSLIQLWGERVQAIEDTAWDLLTERWADVAVGAQLDGIGEIVGEPRLGRTDADYRDAIEIRVSLNRSGGEPERIIEFLRRIAGASTVELRELYPAKLEIFVGSGVTLEQAQRVRELVPAAVGTIYIEESGGETPFGVKEEGAANPSDRDGLGEIAPQEFELSDGTPLELSDGTNLQLTTLENQSLYQYSDGEFGGTLAELFEV